MYSYLNNLYRPILETEFQSEFQIVRYFDKGIKDYGTVSDFIGFCELSKSIQDSEGELIVLQITMDSLSYNGVKWYFETDIDKPEFKKFHWPDIIMNSSPRRGVCQDFAVFVFLVCQCLNVDCWLEFVSYINSVTGQIKFAHTYPIFKIENSYWFWNYSERLVSIHGPFFSLNNALDFSIGYFNILSNTFEPDIFKKDEPLLKSSTILLQACASKNDLKYVIEHYNEPLTRTELWNNVQPIKELKDKIASLQHGIIYKKIIIAPKNQIKFNNINKLFSITKSLGKVAYIRKL